MSLKFKISSNIGRNIDAVQSKLRQLPQQAYAVFVANTPKKSGNARSKTKLRGRVIEADYAYAERLDDGYSKKSPNGMSEPTQTFIEKRLEKIFKES